MDRDYDGRMSGDDIEAVDRDGVSAWVQSLLQPKGNDGPPESTRRTWERWADRLASVPHGRKRAAAAQIAHEEGRGHSGEYVARQARLVLKERREKMRENHPASK
jgi:hypothetical protein